MAKKRLPKIFDNIDQLLTHCSKAHKNSRYVAVGKNTLGTLFLAAQSKNFINVNVIAKRRFPTERLFPGTEIEVWDLDRWQKCVPDDV